MPKKYTPHISQQYNRIGETRVENNFNSTLTRTLSTLEKFSKFCGKPAVPYYAISYVQV
jgi:hypothetical protein